ncbi:GFA family protein [Pseudoalteromonas sp. T1lg48]|uniref:GFA family protein n=1 Tax=Pseudoalteromonas sp. T1lg48 TaxID=2077100 RepID=UPI000CF61C7E|nr:GFA family protein [Pseudoalteromonas sp. T1lg48]
MIKGSCCCKAVQFELSETPDMLGMCHCSRCRKVGASALALIKANTLSITAGRNHIATYKATAEHKYDRCFCSLCGTALGEMLSSSASFPINAHCIDSDIAMENAFHEFVADKPTWFKIGDCAQQFAAHPVEQ